MNNDTRLPRRLVLLAIVTLLIGVAPLAFAARLPGVHSRVPASDRAVVSSLAGGTHAAATPTPATSAIRGVLVTDIDPGAVRQDEGRLILPAGGLGPFNAHDTLSVFVVTAYDAAVVGDEPFDQVTEFVLPDGSNYETRITPVDPLAAAGGVVDRADLAPHPVPLSTVRPMERIGRLLPASASGADLRGQVFTSEVLPVSGTWITRHNLYGEWVVRVSFVRDGETLATAQAAFDLGLGY